MFLEISSTSITSWVSQDLFSLNPCWNSNSMLELAKCFVKLGCDYVFEHFAQNTCDRYRASLDPNGDPTHHILLQY